MTANISTDNLELVEQKPLKPQGEITLQKNEMTYGESWSVLQFNEAKFVDEDTGEEIVGTLAWNDPDCKPEVGERQAEWTFTPDNVAITRSRCEHAKTERRGEVKATCAATGSNRLFDLEET